MNHNKLLKKFREFYFRNYPDDMELQIEYFSIFGGLDIDVDTSCNITQQFQKNILNNFNYLNEIINEITLNNKENKRLLRALAIGDRRIFSAFNRAGFNNGNGGAIIHTLTDLGLIQIEQSREQTPRKNNPNEKLKRADSRHRISHKILFSDPFVRFWFYFISPHRKEIANGDFKNVIKDFNEKRNSYTSLVFEELSEILLNYNIRDTNIVSSGSYWDANIEIDILTITDNKKTFVAECKWKNHKITKKELHKLEDKCKKLEIKPTQIVLFSKRGFSKELKNMQGKNLALYSCKDFQVLVKSSSKEVY